jgi:hypothetical protein
MKRSLIVMALIAFSAGPALAAPGDPRIVQGTLEWPATVTTESFVVIRSDEGRTYYADLATAQRRTPGPLTAGSRVSLLGIERSRPYELTAMVIGTGDAASLGLAPSFTPSPPAPLAPIAVAPLAPAGPAEPMWRVDGIVQSVAGTSITLRTEDGRTSMIDVSQLSDSTVSALRPGERVSLFGVPRQDRRLIANGYLQSESVPPAASPRTTQ